MSEDSKRQRPPKDIIADIKARAENIADGKKLIQERDYRAKAMDRKPTEEEVYELSKKRCLEELELELNEWYWRSGETNLKPMLMEWIRRSDGEGITVRLVKREPADD